ncbi:MAG: tetratricopeptide repeat protein [Crocinitomicaceae bacterium]|nr:tetratricopeptide repeat protein [Crocinitomicaceae bacterium]
MKKNNFYVYFVAVLASLVLAACANLGKMEKHIKDLSAQATPNPLEVHGDSVAINISGKFPEKYFAKKVVAEATPVLVYQGGETKYKTKTYQGEKAAGNGEVVPYKTGKSFSYSDKIGYQPAMETSKLELRIHGTQGTKSADFDPIPVSDGIIATPYLLKSDDKAVSSKDNFVRVLPFSTEAVINFDYNSSKVKPAELKQKDIAELDTFFTKVAANPKMVIKSIEFQAYASPEGEIFLNDNLASERADAGKKVLIDLLKKSKSNTQYEPMMKLVPKGEDWNGFREEMTKSNITDRDIIIRILEKTSDLNSREKEIKNISKTYLEIQNQIFPALRRCIIRVNYDLEGYSDAELKTIASTTPDKLKYEELLKAGSLTEDLGQQASIYSAAEKKAEGDYRAANNLGVVYYQQNKIKDAETQFKKAYEMKKTPETSNNIGIVTRLKGDRKGATAYFNESSAPEAKYNKGLINVQNGDYTSAISNMSGYKTFNTALAKLLNKDNAGAKGDMDASNDSSALADYLKAVIAARSNDSAAVASNLKSAVKKDGSLAEKAKKDLEFRNFKDALNF